MRLRVSWELSGAHIDCYGNGAFKLDTHLSMVAVVREGRPPSGKCTTKLHGLGAPKCDQNQTYITFTLSMCLLFPCSFWVHGRKILACPSVHA